MNGGYIGSYGMIHQHISIHDVQIVLLFHQRTKHFQWFGLIYVRQRNASDKPESATLYSSAALNSQLPRDECCCGKQRDERNYAFIREERDFFRPGKIYFWRTISCRHLMNIRMETNRYAKWIIISEKGTEKNEVKQEVTHCKDGDEPHNFFQTPVRLSV